MLLLANLSKEDKPYKTNLGNLLQGHKCKVTTEKLSQTSLLKLAEKINADGIILSNPLTLAELVQGNANISDWRGSVLKFSTPVLVINPLEHIHSVPHGLWLLKNDLAKLSTLHKPARRLSWKLALHSRDVERFFRKATIDKSIIVCDIETTKANLISMIGYTAISYHGLDTLIVPFLPMDYQSMEDFQNVYRAVKEFHRGDNIFAFHNGGFDCYHLLRYHIATDNYLLDTEYLWYCWEAELPKSLGFLCSVFLFDQYFWKEEKEGDRTQQFEYCAKDCVATARVLKVMLKQIPDWALKNYLIKFPEIFPSIQTAFYGLKVDREKHRQLRDVAEETIEEKRKELQAMAGTPDFNPASPAQVSTFLYDIVGAVRPRRAKGKTATDETSLKKISLQHPLIERICTTLLAFREQQKAFTTYYNAPLYHDRLKFVQRIDGTVSSRWASSASTLYLPVDDARKKDDNYGTQIQNIPPYMKQCLCADDDFTLAEIDKNKSEAHIVAYLANDERLIAAIEAIGVDFYCQLANDFFNLKIDKEHPLRQLMKKTVHGTNYVMWIDTFIDTHGVKELTEYKELLQYKGSLRDFVGYLLGDLYHNTYTGVRPWWERTKIAIARNPLFTTEDGWTRHFHGNILKNSKVHRDAIAHQPQHLSVSVINRAMIHCFGLYLKTDGAFIPLAQIHDSILFQSKTPETHALQVSKYLDIPLYINGRELNIPTTVKTGTYWNEAHD